MLKSCPMSLDLGNRLDKIAARVAELGMKAVAAELHRVLSDCDAVHISLDIDCLDPAFAPGTGIPDSGGLTSAK